MELHSLNSTHSALFRSAKSARPCKPRKKRCGVPRFFVFFFFWRECCRELASQAASPSLYRIGSVERTVRFFISRRLCLCPRRWKVESDVPSYGIGESYLTHLVLVLVLIPVAFSSPWKRAGFFFSAWKFTLQYSYDTVTARSAGWFRGLKIPKKIRFRPITDMIGGKLRYFYFFCMLPPQQPKKCRLSPRCQLYPFHAVR